MVSNLISSRIVKRAIAVCIQQTYGKSFASSIYFISKQTGTEQLVGNNFFGTKTLPQVEKTIGINSGSCASIPCLPLHLINSRGEAESSGDLHSLKLEKRTFHHRTSISL